MTRSSTGGLTFGNNFESISFGPNGSFNMTNGITVSDNFTLNIYGDPNGTDDLFNASRLTLGTNSKLYIDQYASLEIDGVTNFTGRGAWIKVDGHYKTGSISTTGNSSMTLEVDEDATVIVEGDIDMNGNSKLTFLGNGTDPEYNLEEGNSRSIVDIRGQIKTNGNTAEIVADNITVFICNGIDPNVRTDELNDGLFETYCLSALPVQWGDITVTYRGWCHCMEVNWTTFKEWDNSHFEVERSFQGVDAFEMVGRVEGRGWASEISSYQFVEERLPIKKGRVYYRIKQVDYNGSFRYSEVVSHSLPAMDDAPTPAWYIYPNPSYGQGIRLRLSGEGLYKNEEVFVRLLSPGHGSTLPIRLQPNEYNEWDIAALTRNLSQGFYILEIKSGTATTHLKLVRKH
ncbi:hypothetical protein [Negadavirga shengliensis]